MPRRESLDRLHIPSDPGFTQRLSHFLRIGLGERTRIPTKPLAPLLVLLAGILPGQVGRKLDFSQIALRGPVPLKASENLPPDIDEELTGSQATPRLATLPKSLQRTGNRIKTALGKLGHHWHQDGRGARWSAEVS